MGLKSIAHRLLSRAEVGKLSCLMPVLNSEKEYVIKTILWPSKPKIFASWSFIEKLPASTQVYDFSCQFNSLFYFSQNSYYVI